MKKYYTSDVINVHIHNNEQIGASINVLTLKNLDSSDGRTPARKLLLRHVRKQQPPKQPHDISVSVREALMDMVDTSKQSLSLDNTKDHAAESPDNSLDMTRTIATRLPDKTRNIPGLDMTRTIATGLPAEPRNIPGLTGSRRKSATGLPVHSEPIKATQFPSRNVIVGLPSKSDMHITGNKVLNKTRVTPTANDILQPSSSSTNVKSFSRSMFDPKIWQSLSKTGSGEFDISIYIIVIFIIMIFIIIYHIYKYYTYDINKTISLYSYNNEG